MQSTLLLSKKNQPLFACKVNQNENNIDLFKKWVTVLIYDNKRELFQYGNVDRKTYP